MCTVFLCYTSQKAEVNQKEPVPCLKILSQDACSLIPRKQYRISLLVASQLIDSVSEAVLRCVRISQGERAPP